MSSPNPRRGHHVINNGVKDIYRDIIKRFVDTFGTTYLDSNNYLNLVQLNIINEVRMGGLPADCVLRTAPMPHDKEKKLSKALCTPQRERPIRIIETLKDSVRLNKSFYSKSLY